MEWGTCIFLLSLAWFMSDEPHSTPTLKNHQRTLAVCDLIVDAGPGLALCYPGGEVTLDGSITGEYVHFEWTP